MASTKIRARQIQDIATGTAVTGGGANRVLYLNALENLASSANFTFDGTNLSVAKTGWNGTEYIIEQTGDTYGTTRLRLRNRDGSNGAVFENAGLDLVDFAFKPNAGYQGNLRYEHRNGSIWGGGDQEVGEFQFYDTNYTSFFFTTNKNVTAVRTGKFGVGVSDPAAQIHSLATTEQLRVGYDSSNYFSTTVSSVGTITFNAAGSTPRFDFSKAVQLNAVDLSVINSTAATGGAPVVKSPYVYLNGRRWNGSADAVSNVRLYSSGSDIGGSDHRPVFAIDFNDGSGWNESFSIGAAPSGVGNLSTYIKVRHPSQAAWGGAIGVSYTGDWEFYNTANVKSGLSPGYISWGANPNWKNLEPADFGYGTRFNTVFGGDIIFHANSNQLDTHFKYDDSNYASLSVSSAGTATFNAVGTTPRFDFLDSVTVGGTQEGSANLTVGGDYATAAILGGSAADMILKHTNAAVNEKMVVLRSQSGFGGFSSFTDGYSYQVQNIVGWSNATGKVGMGLGSTLPSTAQLEIRSTYEQLRLSYDGSNYFSATVAANGLITFNGTGAGTGFDFNKRIRLNPSSGNGYVEISAATNSGITIAADTVSGYYPAVTFIGASGTQDITGYDGLMYNTQIAHNFRTDGVSRFTIGDNAIHHKVPAGFGVAPNASYVLDSSGATQFTNGNGGSHLPYTDGKIYLSAPEMLFRDASNSTHSFWSSTGLYVGGTVAPTAKFQVSSTTEQLRVLYDGSNYVKLTIGSAGLATWDGAGTSAAFRFDKKVERKVNTSTAYAQVGGTIYQHLTNATTPNLSTTTFYTATLPANTFAVDGDHVVMEYTLTTAANANNKTASVSIAGTDVANVDTNGSDVDIRFIVTATRVSSSALRVSATAYVGTAVEVVYNELTGLTLTNSMNVLLAGRSIDQAGDITARFGIGRWYPGV